MAKEGQPIDPQLESDLELIGNKKGKTPSNPDKPTTPPETLKVETTSEDLELIS